MHTIIRVRDKNILVQLKENNINIINDEELKTLAALMPEAATDELVATIKKQYHAQFDKEFDVSNASMAVEIWGHVFADKFAETIKSISPIELVDKLAEKISSRSEVINMGEKDHDNNRIVWDLLAPFKRAIAVVLLKRN